MTERISLRRDVTCLRNFVRDSLLWSLSFSLSSGRGQWDRSSRSRPKGWNLVGSMRRDADDGADRAVARGPELKTRLMETHAETSAYSRAQAPPRLSALWSFSVTRKPPRRRAVLVPRCCVVLSKESLSSSTSRVSTLGRSRATFFSFPLALFHNCNSKHTYANDIYMIIRFTKTRITLCMFKILLHTLYILKFYFMHTRTHFFKRYLKNNNIYICDKNNIVRKICIYLK